MKELNIFSKIVFLVIIGFVSCTSNKLSVNDNYPSKKVNKVDKQVKKLYLKNNSINKDTTIFNNDVSIEIKNFQLSKGIKIFKKLDERIIIIYGKNGNLWKVYIESKNQIDTFYHPNGLINEPW